MTGLLLINLGTPDSPHPKDVRRYLRQFLSDPRVIDIPGWRRRLLLEAVILPRRPRQSGEAYRKIWTERGSPLLFHTSDLAQEVQRLAGNDVVVTFAMRYREPAIDGQISKLLARGVDRITGHALSVGPRDSPVKDGGVRGLPGS